MSQLAWMNNTVHPTFNQAFMPDRYAESEEARKEVRRGAIERYRPCLERIQGWVAGAAPFWFGARLSFHDAYAFALLRWGGLVGIDPASLPGYRAYLDRVMQAGPVAAALARERVKLDTFKVASH
jgi:glutathione S-transferase